MVERDGTRLVSVVMGAPYSNGRYTDSIAMLDYAFEKLGTPAEVIEMPKVTIPSKIFYINDLPIAGFIQEETYLIRVEDLREYGFDVNYHPDTNTLEIINRPQKPMHGMEKKEFPQNAEFADGKAVNVVVKKTPEDMGLYTVSVYDLSGSAAIDVQELAYLGWVIPRGEMATIVTR